MHMLTLVLASRVYMMTCLYTCMLMLGHIHMCVHRDLPVYTHAHVSTCIMCVRDDLTVYMYAHIRTYTRVYIATHLCTHMLVLADELLSLFLCPFQSNV